MMSTVTRGTALEPSQNRRSSHRRSSSSLLGIVLGATLALSACGGQQVGAAAIVDGTSISDKDVQSVSLQLNALAKGQANLPASTVILSLILAPYVRDETARTQKKVMDAQVLKVIDKVPGPSPATIEFVRMQLALQTLDQTSKTTILARLGKAKITVNPRYGRFDPKTIALVPIAPNWMKASATTGAK